MTTGDDERKGTEGAEDAVADTAAEVEEGATERATEGATEREPAADADAVEATSESDDTEGSGESESTAPAAESTPEAALGVAVLITRGDSIVLQRPRGRALLSIPTTAVAPGESLAGAAARLAASLDPTAEGTAEAGHEAAGPAVRPPADVLGDGVSVPAVGPAGDAERAPPRPSWLGMTLARGALPAGSCLWVVGIVIALDRADLIRGRTAEKSLLFLLPVAVVLGLVFGRRHALPESVGAKIGSVIASILFGIAVGGALGAFAAWVAIDDDRAAFWFFTFGASCVLLSTWRILAKSPSGSSLTPRTRRLLWAAVILASFALVFVPLREVLRDTFERDSTGRTHTVQRDPFAHDE